MPTPGWPSTAYDTADMTDAVSHCTPDGWTFAIATNTSIIDGTLDLAADVPAEKAQAALVDTIERGLGHSIEVQWTRSESKPVAWSTDIAISPPDEPVG